MKIVKKNDILIILAVLLLALGAKHLLGRGERATANVIINGNTEYVIDLSREKELRYIKPDTDPAITIAVENGTIRFCRADCPDKLCVEAGVLSKPGDTAACLPAKAVIVVKGESKDSPDALTY